jgi:uncharacterized RDD family membrane protein YckC
VSGWVDEPLRQQVVQTGEAVEAGMGRRILAWIIDAIVASFLVLIPFSFAMALRAVTVNTDVIDKLANNPAAIINEKFLAINAPVVWLAVAGWIVLRAAYFGGCWNLFRCTLGQRLLSVEVVAVEDSESLPVWRAVVRWLALEGVGQILAAVALVLVIQVLASVPFSQTSYGAAVSSGGDTVDPSGRAANSLSTLATWGSAIWSIVLLVSVALNARKLGIHDRLAGSVVLARPPRGGWQKYERWGHTEVVPTSGVTTTEGMPHAYGVPPTGYAPTFYPGGTYPQGRPWEARQPGPPNPAEVPQTPPQDGPAE